MIARLEEVYLKYMAHEPDSKVIREIEINVPEGMEFTCDFIIQNISSDSKLMDEKYLHVPDENSLRFIHLIYEYLKYPDNPNLIDSLLNAEIPRLTMIDNYYRILFVGMKNKLSHPGYLDRNFIMSDYGLKTKEEKAIFFLRCMSNCFLEINGFLNGTTPYYSRAYSIIKSFPKFDGLPYYLYDSFDFPDFNLVIRNYEPPESYKAYFLRRYFSLLLYHIDCLDALSEDVGEKKGIISKSIINRQDLYKYSTNAERLNGLMQ